MKSITAIFSGIILALMLCQCKSKPMDNYMIVGTYTHSGSKGIYVYNFNADSGNVELVSTASDIKNPSYLWVSKENVYAASETNGDTPGSVSAYSLDKQNGSLHLLNNLPTGGDDPCFVEADASGKFVAVANYSGGSVTIFPTDEKGALIDKKQLVQHEGGSVNPDRQQGPHVHQSIFSPDQKFLLTPDLGKDEVMVYAFDKSKAQPLSLHATIQCAPGSGPRHIAFHPHKKFAYLMHELKPFVTVYSFDNGNFKAIQNINAYPEDFEGNKDGAEVMVSPDGKFLYTSQRADQNTIGIFQIDEATGELTLKGFEPVLGKGPRYFTFDPSGKFLLVANQLSDNITIFEINKETGMLKPSGNIDIPIPVCIQFAEK